MNVWKLWWVTKRSVTWHKCARIVQVHSSVVVLTALSWIYKECVLHCRYQPSQSLLPQLVPYLLPLPHTFPLPHLCSLFCCLRQPLIRFPPPLWCLPLTFPLPQLRSLFCCLRQPLIGSSPPLWCSLVWSHPLTHLLCQPVLTKTRLLWHWVDWQLVL